MAAAPRPTLPPAIEHPAKCTHHFHHTSLPTTPLSLTSYRIWQVDLSSAIKLGPSGACVLAEWLRENVHAHTIGLQGTAIADEGLRMLSDVIATHPSVTSIDLRSSGVGERGLHSLAEALRAVSEPRLAYVQHEAWGRAIYPGQTASLRLPNFSLQAGAQLESRGSCRAFAKAHW